MAAATPCGCRNPVTTATAAEKTPHPTGEQRRRRRCPRTEFKDEERGRGGRHRRAPAGRGDGAQAAREVGVRRARRWARIRRRGCGTGGASPGTARSDGRQARASRSVGDSGGGGDIGPRAPLLISNPGERRRACCAGGKSPSSAAESLLSKVATAVVMGLLAVASAQEETTYPAAAVGVMVPLTPAGLQYTANVTVASGNYSSTAALIVDTTVSMVAFPVCSNVTGVEEGDSADEEGGGGDGNACIPFGDTLDEAGEKPCRAGTLDGGTVSLHPEDPPSSQFLPYLQDQEVSLSTNVSASGSVFATFNTTVADNSGTLDGWDGAAGVLGLARFPHTTCMSDGTEVNGSLRSVFSQMDGADSVFALDLGDESYNSTLEIGGYSGSSSSTVGDVQWGQRLTAAFPSSWGFPAFDLAVCGRSLMSNITAFWPAVVSTGSACLGLPQEFFDSLMSWLPVEGDCPDPENGGMCSISAENAAMQLPSLSFRLSQHGQELYLPLSALLLDEDGDQPSTSTSTSTNDGGDRRLCVTREAAIRQSGWLFELPSMQPVVSLGTLPLRSLYAVVDTEIGRVGLAQKGDVGDSALGNAGNNTSCNAAAVCVGMQRFQESYNACEDPSCSSYYLTNLDDETMTCKSTGIMTILVWVFGMFFGITEMAGHFLRAYYGGTGVGLRGHQHHQGWEFHTGRLIEACLGKATRSAGLSQPHHERTD